MFEAKLAQAALFKKIIDAIKDLISDAPFDVSETALCLQVSYCFCCEFRLELSEILWRSRLGASLTSLQFLTKNP